MGSPRATSSAVGVLLLLLPVMRCSSAFLVQPAGQHRLLLRPLANSRSTFDAPLQSFDEEQLQRLLREHRASEVEAARQQLQRQVDSTAQESVFFEQEQILDDDDGDLPRHPEPEPRKPLASWAKALRRAWQTPSATNTGHDFAGSIHHNMTAVVESPRPLLPPPPPVVERAREVASLDEYKRVVADERHRLTVVRFYAPWCRACKAMEPAFAKLSRQFPAVQFVQVPVTPETAALHQGLGIPRVPYGHVVHPVAGIVEELSLNRKYVTDFTYILQSYVQASCPLPEADGDDESLWAQSPYQRVS
jgi:thiol-disulfide isomerase/thioredoxin